MFDKDYYLAEHESIFAEYRKKYENRNSYLFVDGIIDPHLYGAKSCGEILVLLKEAYSKEQEKGEWNLVEHLASDKPWGMWNRVSEWIYGISKTSEATIAPYRDLADDEKHAFLRTAAVINVKKANGTSTSDDNDLDRYTESNALLLRREIESVCPKIIICGNTFRYLKKIFNVKPVVKNDNWYYWIDLGNLKNVLVLDYYHPAVQYPSLLTYYGLVNIYQQALLNGRQE